MIEPQQAKSPELSDSELLQLVGDPTMTPEDWAKLTPGETKRLQSLSAPKADHSKAIDMVKSALSTGGDLITGAAKGAGETAFNLGNAVHSIPGVGNITDFLAKALGPEGTDPDQAFAQVPGDLAASNTAQKVGKGAERIAEFVAPSRATFTAGSYLGRPALNAWLGTSQKARPILSGALSAAEKGLNIAGDAAMSGAVGAAQGGDAIDAAKWSAGGDVGGEVLSQAMRGLNTATGQKLGPLLAAIAAMKAMESMGGGISGTLGGGLGGFSVARSLANQVIRKPGSVRRMRDVAELAGKRAGQIGAGASNVESDSGPRRRSQ